MPKPRSAPTDAAGLAHGPTLLGALGLVDSHQDVLPEWVAQSVRMVSAQWPLFMLSKLSLLMVSLNGRALLEAHNSAFLVALGGIFLFDAVIWRVPRLGRFRATMPHRQMRLMTAMAFLSGLTTSLWFNLLPPEALGSLIPPTYGQWGLALIALCIFGHQRILGLAYCLGSSVSLIDRTEPGLWLLNAVLLATIAASALGQARFDRRRLMVHREEEVRRRRAGYLLSDYEESGRGWFWETDRQGALTYISAALARSMGLAPGTLLGRRLGELVSSGAVGEGEKDRTLGFHLSARSAFSDLSVCAIIADEERWWAISGHPVINAYGQFQGFRGSGSDLTEMKRSQAEVTRLAQFDALTGLANRVQMARTLEQSLMRPHGAIGTCALFLLDLDRFKTVNDTLGHPAGDALLKDVAHRLRRVVGEQGMVGRLGGDEFEVVLPGATERKRLAVLADAIIAALSQPYFIEGTQVIIGASIGIAICPEDGTTADTLTRNADLALYVAKGGGRGIHCFYSSKMLAEAEDRRVLEEDLRVALANGALDLVYQPVVSAKTEKITGFEALLRWNHPARGAISPAVFVPIAEDAGLIGAMGEWVMRTACAAAADWPEGLRIAVNVSPLQFTNPALPGIVMNALASSGLAPERLELEITESAFLNDGEANEQMFANLKKIGVRLALDDFGTGYSSLGYLKKAPFDKIKIDQGFVRGAAIKGNRNAAIITSIVSLAEALGMDTTAEGVETHDELELVRSLGCSQIQGHIYGKGSSAAEVTRQLRENGVTVQASGFQSSRPARSSMLRSVAVLHEGQRYIGRIRNISHGGAMVEGLWNVPPGACFSIEIADGLTVEAEARWSVDDRMGVQFRQPVDVRMVKALGPVRLAG